MIVDEEGIAQNNTGKRRAGGGTSGKRVKLDTEERAAWGEANPEQSNQESRNQFLYSVKDSKGAAETMKQATLKPVTGVTWMCMRLIEDIVKRAQDWAEMLTEMSTWEEWEPVNKEENQSKRSKKEEQLLWK